MTLTTAPALAVGAQVPSALTRHDTAAVLGCWLVSDRRSQYECQHCQGLQTKTQAQPRAVSRFVSVNSPAIPSLQEPAHPFRRPSLTICDGN